MVNVAIVEDDSAYAEKIYGYIKMFSTESGERIDVSFYSDGDEIIAGYKSVYDIIFMDIYMGRMDGMTAAEHIRRLDKNVILIFITNMPGYAIKGYAVNALSFLLKPVSYFAFSHEIKNAVKSLKRKSQYVLLPAEKGVVKLNADDIIYIESIPYKILIHSKQGDYRVPKTMKMIEESLGGMPFFRCNKCYLVNLNCVTGIRENFAILGNIKLQVSRPKKKLFLKALTEFVGGMNK